MKNIVIHQISCQESTSASCLTGIREPVLVENKTNALFSHGGMDTNARVQLLLCEAALERNTETLGDFASVGGQDVEADNLVGGLLNQDLGVTTALDSLVVLPLKGFEGDVEALQVILVLFTSLFLTQANASILDGSENSSWH